MAFRPPVVGGNQGSHGWLLLTFLLLVLMLMMLQTPGGQTAFYHYTHISGWDGICTKEIINTCYPNCTNQTPPSPPDEEGNCPDIGPEDVPGSDDYFYWEIAQQLVSACAEGDCDEVNEDCKPLVSEQFGPSGYGYYFERCTCFSSGPDCESYTTRSDCLQHFCEGSVMNGHTVDGIVKRCKWDEWYGCYCPFNPPPLLFP